MKKFYTLCAAYMLYVFSQSAVAQVIRYTDSWGTQGLTLTADQRSALTINCSLEEFQFEPVIVDGITMNAVRTPGVFLFNDAGAPDLPVISRYVAIPAGTQASLQIRSSRTERYSGVDIAPAPVIPLDTDPGPLQYKKDPAIYNRDAFWPENPVVLSDLQQIRGVDVVVVAVTPFQYNPVTRELIVYRDLEISIELTGGTGRVGDDRLRSRWWDPLLFEAVLNPEVIPEMDWQATSSANRTPDYEYLIITPNLPAYLQWADSIKTFRTLQGIRTGVVTTTDVGGNTTTAIKNYVTNAYNNWDIPPVAVLLLGDYSTGTDGITSYLYPHIDPRFTDFASDNYFADVTGDNLPDIIFARITARNATELEVMVGKFLSYERNPPTDAGFYAQPVTALGWQTERWFQLCSETVGGYLKNVKGKNPIRINALYQGNPGVDPWSTASGTSTVVNYFGPAGRGYIPSTPQELGGFTGGTGSQIVTAINNGTFMVMHRDHGMYSGWGEPYFTSANISYLNNVNNELPFVFSINCQTGAYHLSTECFTEKFHRWTYGGQGSGALGLLAATEVSYSFVNDIFVWGVFDNMFPDFMPDKTTQFPTSFVMPAFANAAGKYHLYQSNWYISSSTKLITYRLFHHHGDAFMTLFTEVPQELTVSHSSSLPAGQTSFDITANTGSMIALTVSGQIIATATGTGAPQSIAIPAQSGGQVMTVTITKQNYYRYSAEVDIVSGGVVANFSGTPTALCAGSPVSFTDLSFGEPTSWYWTFEGGNPATWEEQIPPPVYYANAGTYSVTLSVSNDASTDTETKAGYISVSALEAGFSASASTIVIGQPVTFTDQSTCATSWQWSFTDGSPESYTGQYPPAILYDTEGVFPVSLTVGNGSTTDTFLGSITVTGIQYCSSSGNATQEWINAFTLNGETVTSGSSGQAGYQDYTGTTFALAPGNTYSLTLVPGFSGSSFMEYYKIWIDFNHDGDFSDSGEEVFSAAKKKSTVTGTISIPSGLETTTRMRVSMKRNGFAAPCDAAFTGEVEDYTVSFAPPTPQPPVADFTASPLTLAPGQSVQFTDLSTQNPISWAWTFVGGTPSTSTDQNPVVTYNSIGDFDVTLIATNAVGNSTLIRVDYIHVTDNPVTTYCTPVAISNSSDYINSISIGTQNGAAGQGSGGYVYYENIDFFLTTGQSYSVSMSPFNSSNRNFWRIWIDFNGDGDFTDADETLFSANNKKGTTMGTITIPGYATDTRRMRVSMKTGGSQLPCDDNFSGEVEDYDVVFTPPEDLLSLEAFTLQAYPNPTSGQLTVRVTGNQGPARVQIYSVQGRLIHSHRMEQIQEQIDLTGQLPGMYFVHVNDGYHTAIQKITLR